MNAVYVDWNEQIASGLFSLGQARKLQANRVRLNYVSNQEEALECLRIATSVELKYSGLHYLKIMLGLYHK